MSDSQRIYIFLDEGGNFDFSLQGSKFFTLTTLTTVRPFAWENSLLSLKYDFLERGYAFDRFHATEDKQEVRNRVFEVISNHLDQIRLDALVVEKRKTGPALQPIEKFYPRMLGYLLRYVLEHVPQIRQFQEVLVFTDAIPVKRKREAVEKAIKQTLTSFLAAGTRYRIFHHESKSCLSLQVVDYCNWAIFRKWEKSDLRSYQIIARKVKSEFDIFRTGVRHYY